MRSQVLALAEKMSLSGRSQAPNLDEVASGYLGVGHEKRMNIFQPLLRRLLVLQGSKGTWELGLSGMADTFLFKELKGGRGVGEMAGAAAALED